MANLLRTCCSPGFLAARVDTSAMALHLTPDSAPHARRSGASRPTIVLGYAALGGLIGMVAGAPVAFNVLGLRLPDNTEGLEPAVMVTAGLGWLVGAGFGSVAGAHARPAGVAGRWLLLAGAIAVVVGAVAIAIWPVRSGWPETETIFFSFWRHGGDELAFVIVTMVDAALAVGTFVAVGRHHDVEGSSRPTKLAGAIGIAGLVLGGLWFALGMALLPLSWSGSLTSVQRHAVWRTTSGVADAVGDYADRTGAFPTNLEDVRAAFRRIRPGTQVQFAGVVNGSFCIRVGVDVGEQHASDPHYSVLVHRRPPGSNSWTSSETQLGNSCTF